MSIYDGNTNQRNEVEKVKHTYRLKGVLKEGECWKSEGGRTPKVQVRGAINDTARTYHESSRRRLKHTSGIGQCLAVAQKQTGR
jgi:hypothetical protein